VNQLLAAFNPDGSLLSPFFFLEWNANVLGGPDGCGSICSFFVANAVFSADRYWSLGAGPDDYGINGQFSVTNPNPVPAPATLVLFGLGLAGLGWSRRKNV
jgi:PEP-CTERM motif